MQELESNSTKSGFFDTKIELQLLLYKYMDNQRNWYLRLFTSIVSNSDSSNSRQQYFSYERATKQLFETHKEEIRSGFIKKAGRDILVFDSTNIQMLQDAIMFHFTRERESLLPSAQLIKLGIDVEVSGLLVLNRITALVLDLLLVSIYFDF